MLREAGSLTSLLFLPFARVSEPDEGLVLGTPGQGEKPGELQIALGVHFDHDGGFLLQGDLSTRTLSLDEVAALGGVEDRADFRIDADGSFLEWPVADVHLDAPGTLDEIDPDHRARPGDSHGPRSVRFPG